MPLYEYECKVCGQIFEKAYKLDDADKTPACPYCGPSVVKILSAKILRDEPTWLNDEVRGVLQDTEAEKPIENRTDYNRYLKDNGIEAR